MAENFAFHISLFIVFLAKFDFIDILTTIWYNLISNMQHVNHIYYVYISIEHFTTLRQ